MPIAGAGPRSRAYAELIVVAIATAMFAWLSVELEVGERLLAWTQPREHYQVDELPGVLVVLAIGLAWFSWRRASDASAELRERRSAQRALSDALAENRRLARRILDIQESERRALARELHDELGQTLNALKIDAVWVRDGCAQRDDGIGSAAASIVRLCDQAQGALAQIVRNLRPPGLDELGLAAALEDCVDRWRRRLPAIRFDCRWPRELAPGDAVGITLYRAVQEGLTNIARHANARHVEIRVDEDRGGASAPGAVTLSLRDDGRGSAVPWRDAGLGLVGMRERVEGIGGTLDIRTAPGEGFALRARIPMADGSVG